MRFCLPLLIMIGENKARRFFSNRLLAVPKFSSRGAEKAKKYYSLAVITSLKRHCAFLINRSRAKELPNSNVSSNHSHCSDSTLSSHRFMLQPELITTPSVNYNYDVCWITLRLSLAQTTRIGVVRDSTARFVVRDYSCQKYVFCEFWRDILEVNALFY